MTTPPPSLELKEGVTSDIVSLERSRNGIGAAKSTPLFENEKLMTPADRTALGGPCENEHVADVELRTLAETLIDEPKRHVADALARKLLPRIVTVAPLSTEIVDG